MMKTRFNMALFIVLILQITVAVSMHHVSTSNVNEQFNQPIMDIKASSVERISVDDGKDLATALSRVNDQWQLDNYHQLPADQNKVKSVLDKLEKDKSGWPVATTESSRLRFKVADDDYRKKLVLSSDAGDKTLYLGVSPGFRQLNVRRQDEEQVYAVKLNDYDFPLKDVDWLDKTLLQPKADISSISAADFSLIKQQGKWALDNNDQAVDSKQVDKITSTLSRLRVQSAEDKTAAADAYQIELRANDKDYQYKLFKLEDNYYISRNDYKVAFKISQSDYESLTVADVEQLLEKKASNDATEQSPEQQSDSASS
jgi:PHD/YefM family antitoxin component YafN of YafNO toxin-antitoxin module